MKNVNPGKRISHNQPKAKPRPKTHEARQAEKYKPWRQA